jgi:hypothetical protein
MQKPYVKSQTETGITNSTKIYKNKIRITIVTMVTNPPTPLSMTVSKAPIPVIGGINVNGAWTGGEPTDDTWMDTKNRHPNSD